MRQSEMEWLIGGGGGGPFLQLTYNYGREDGRPTFWLRECASASHTGSVFGI